MYVLTLRYDKINYAESDGIYGAISDYAIIDIHDENLLCFYLFVYFLFYSPHPTGQEESDL